MTVRLVGEGAATTRGGARFYQGWLEAPAKPADFILFLLTKPAGGTGKYSAPVQLNCAK